jgi:hypothetical protein
MAGKEVVSAEEEAATTRAVIEARRDSDFIIKARTDATATHGLKEAICRFNLYSGLALAGYLRLVTGAAIQGMKNALAVLLQPVAEGRVIERRDLATPVR